MTTASDPRTTVESELSATFRSAMRLHPAGVCVLTTGVGETVNGMAATAVTSLSMDPPSMLACVNRSASIAGELRRGSMFGITILAGGHQAVAAAFSRKPTGRARFDHGSWRFGDDSLPWLDDAPANLSCVLEKTFVYGTHRALIGRVTGVRLGPVAPGLIYRDGAYV